MQMMVGAYSAAQSAMSGFPVEAPLVCNLTARELACLVHYVAGHDKKRTGETLGISARTVEGHLERARLRCGVDNTLAAAMKALNEGWISPSEVRQLEATG
jgi:DNA-binding CsgD family transcriptional regulator